MCIFVLCGNSHVKKKVRYQDKVECISYQILKLGKKKTLINNNARYSVICQEMLIIWGCIYLISKF